jgi:hypothetical protein
MCFLIKLASKLSTGRTIHFNTRVKADTEVKARNIALERWSAYKPTIVSVEERE